MSVDPASYDAIKARIFGAREPKNSGGRRRRRGKKVDGGDRRGGPSTTPPPAEEAPAAPAVVMSLEEVPYSRDAYNAASDSAAPDGGAAAAKKGKKARRGKRRGRAAPQRPQPVRILKSGERREGPAADESGALPEARAWSPFGGMATSEIAGDLAGPGDSLFSSAHFQPADAPGPEGSDGGSQEERLVFVPRDFR